ncbi:MAG TPA: DUF2933 domain-containing protein [Acidothermaceae bacterium]
MGFPLLLIVCPLAMLLMVRGMGGPRGGNDDMSVTNGPTYPERIDAPVDRVFCSTRR